MKLLAGPEKQFTTTGFTNQVHQMSFPLTHVIPALLNVIPAKAGIQQILSPSIGARLPLWWE
jgi:hypothetical protein